MSPWSLMMEQLLGALRNEKVSSATLILIITGAWYTYGWANDEFVNKGDFDKLTTLIVTHVEDMKIVDAAQLLRDKELALQIATATNEPQNQIQHVLDEVNEARRYKECLIKKEPNCKHLKPPE